MKKRQSPGFRSPEVGISVHCTRLFQRVKLGVKLGFLGGVLAVDMMGGGGTTEQLHIVHQKK